MMPTEPMFHQDIGTYPLPPPPKRTFLPEPEWGTSSSAEEITAAYDVWYPIIKEIFTCCEESEVR
jgi:hypothetical protein